MHISTTAIKAILSNPAVSIEYHGTHNSDNQNPLWGRKAYWRVYLDGQFITKITAPVKSISPRPETLYNLLLNELRLRFRNSGPALEHNEWGDLILTYKDPYSLLCLIKSLKNKGLLKDYTNYA